MCWSIVATLLSTTAFGQDPESIGGSAPVNEGGPLVVGTHPVPPFVVHEADGTWKGISIELWEHIAHELGITYEIREFEVKELVENASGDIDVAVSLNISPRSEQAYDMTHAFLSTGLAIAVRPQATSIGTALLRVLTPSFLGLVGGVAVMLLGAGALMWSVERKTNEDLAGTSGLWSGVLWAVETVIGYGDPVHKTPAGRLLAIAWAGFGVIILSALTAQLSSQLTLTGLETSVSGPDDLPRVDVGTVDPSAGLRYCERRGLSCKKYADAEQALTALVAGEVDAIVYEAPILKYWGNRRWPDQVLVLPGTFDNHGYGLGLVQGSPLRESVNLALLQYTTTDDFRSMMARYLGSALD